MKIRLLVFTLLGLGLTCATQAVETPETSGFIDPSDIAGVEIPDPGVNAMPKPHGTEPNLNAQ